MKLVISKVGFYLDKIDNNRLMWFYLDTGSQGSGCGWPWKQPFSSKLKKICAVK